MSVRDELEAKLISFAATNNIALSLEGVPFVRPSGLPYLQCWMLGSQPADITVDATRKRIRGVFAINVCCLDGRGSKQVETLAAQVTALYPIVPKELFSTCSIEQTPQTGQAMIDSNYRIIPVTVRYRQEA